jgi:hypothetical protein
MFFVTLKIFITIFPIEMFLVAPFSIASLVVDKKFVPRVSCFNSTRGSFSHMCEMKIENF